VLNRALLESAPALREGNVSIVAQTGEKDFAALSDSLKPYPNVKLAPFFSDIWKQVEEADLVVCRAGALTVAELCAAGRPSLLVPFAAAAHGHQEANARELEKAGAAVVIPEDRALRGLAAEIAALLAAPDRLAGMGRAARKLGRPDATGRIVDLFFHVSGEAA